MRVSVARPVSPSAVRFSREVVEREPLELISLDRGERPPPSEVPERKRAIDDEAVERIQLAEIVIQDLFPPPDHCSAR
jgi:hypothetical protein